MALAEYQNTELVVDKSELISEEKQENDGAEAHSEEEPATENIQAINTGAQSSIICPSCTSNFVIPQNTSSAEPTSLAQGTTSIHLASTPTNILLAVRSTHRLFNEFQDQLTAKSREILQLEHEVEEMSLAARADKEMVEVALRGKEEMRKELNAVKADDESASKVVERYM